MQCITKFRSTHPFLQHGLPGTSVQSKHLYQLMIWKKQLLDYKEIQKQASYRQTLEDSTVSEALYVLFAPIGEVR